jgi:hypothetical protein
MSTTKIISVKSPTWVRALQIGIGAIAIGLSLSAIVFPILTVVAAFTAAAIILLLFGIEQVVSGIFLYKRSRFAHIGLGILVIPFKYCYGLSSCFYSICCIVSRHSLTV